MQFLDVLTLKHLAAELRRGLVGLKINKVQQPSRQEFLLGLWGKADLPAGFSKPKLYINLSPDFAFCAVVGETGFIRGELAKPTAFCMLLRKHLTGARLQEVATLPGERVLDFTFENFNELGNRVRLVLSLELMGKHANMILYDAEQRLILGAAHPVTEAMSRYREVAAGLPYCPPPRPAGKRLLEEISIEAFGALLEGLPPAEWPEALTQHLWGVGKGLLKHCLEGNTDDPRAFYDTLWRIHQGEAPLQPAIDWEKNRYTLFGATQGEPLPSVLELVRAYYLTQLETRRLEGLRRELTRRVADWTARHAKQHAILTPVEETRIQQLRHWGDLLLSAHSAGGLIANAHQVTLTDYTTGEPVTLALDPALSAVENAQRYYRRAQKEQGKLRYYQERLAGLAQEKAFLDDMGQWIAQAETLDDLEALREEFNQRSGKASTAAPTGKPSAKQSPGKPATGILSLTSGDGTPILVGKTGEANALLAGKLSRPDDIWLHAHQMPGSHVLIKTEGRPPSDATLLAAASLAAYFSAARQGDKVPVIYTESRYVRKIAGSYPGHVTYQKEKTVFVTPRPPE